MTLRKSSGTFLNAGALKDIGLDHLMIRMAIDDTYDLLDKIDRTLLNAGVFPLSQTVELANLSSMIGNIFAAALAHRSDGALVRNGPHKYPDLLATGSKSDVPDIEIKMALENNKPKGHLAKPGQYLTCRYILCDAHGVPSLDKKNRGTIRIYGNCAPDFLRRTTSISPIHPATAARQPS